MHLCQSPEIREKGDCKRTTAPLTLKHPDLHFVWLILAEVNNPEQKGNPHLHPRTLLPIDQLLQQMMRAVGRQARGCYIYII